MISPETVKIFSSFLLLLSVLRLWDSDYIGFFIFLLFSFLFSLSSRLESKKEKKAKETESRRKFFYNLSNPKLVLKKEGNSDLVTFVVPSLEFFNEIMSNDRNI